MRRNAGSYVRSKLVRLGMLGTAGAGVLMGLGLTPLFHLINVWAGQVWAVAAYVGTAAVVFVIVSRIDRLPGRWSFGNLRKGLDAETRVGQIIEYAITAEHCAVAHSVTGIAKVGDIDHIVATPAGIWVIETKYRKVPRRIFSEVLGRIAANTGAVRKWAPAGTHVRGCLVLAYERERGKKTFTRGNEKIGVYTEKTLGELRRELRNEARGGKLPDGQIATDVWNLSHITE